ncbi:MAG TPA: hypothetical protein VFG39_02530 [Balneolaceae bacterium]|nr:hypothetical protein [Balneolaceae bacterium]
MPWFALLLTFAGGYIALKLYGINNNRGKLKFLGLAIASSIFVVIQLSVFVAGATDSSTINAVSDFIVEWGHIACLAFILSSLVIFIRQSKPAFAQFPMAYTALPILILISYFLVKDTYALKNWLLSIYQGGAILVALLMYSVYTYRNRDYILILSGVFVLLLSYISYWHIPAVTESEPWIWKLLMIIGLLTTIFGYLKVEKTVAVNTTLQKEPN